MFTLVTERNKYYRVKRGQNGSEIEKVLKTPVSGEVYGGRIIKVFEGDMEIYSAKVGDNYRKIAEKYALDEQTLKNVNFDRPIYPTSKIFVPKK